MCLRLIMKYLNKCFFFIINIMETFCMKKKTLRKCQLRNKRGAP